MKYMKMKIKEFDKMIDEIKELRAYIKRLEASNQAYKEQVDIYNKG